MNKYFLDKIMITNFVDFFDNICSAYKNKMCAFSIYTNAQKQYGGRIAWQ